MVSMLLACDVAQVTLHLAFCQQFCQKNLCKRQKAWFFGGCDLATYQPHDRFIGEVRLQTTMRSHMGETTAADAIAIVAIVSCCCLVACLNSGQLSNCHGADHWK